LRRILFVDDEQHILAGLRDLLRKHRHELDMIFAPGGAEALQELEKAPFDVIVSDMRMPKMDGAMLLQRVKDQYPDVVRIILSGHADRDAIFMALPVAHQFLAKPCDSNDLKNVIERACRLRSLLNDETLRKPVGGIEKLPSFPVLYHRIMNAMTRPDASADTISAIIEQDPAMSAKILQLANSACFGTARRIVGIQQAVVHLGMELIKNLALAVNIFGAAEKSSGSSIVSFKEQQVHALQTARVAARVLPAPQQSQHAFTAGLLHDIGNVVLAVSIPDRFASVVECCRESKRAAHEVELEMLGVTHAEVGAYLLGLWGLPYPIIEAVAYHHNPAAASERSFGIPSATNIASTLVDELSGPAPEIPFLHLESLGVAGNLPRWRAIAQEEALTVAAL
jgi:HD-like signal output (HDOD) protein/CheY-like chemotaxis protein